MGLHIVLYQPDIPANTGNIARTCAGTNTKLHLIKPLGFSTDNKMLKRAGLDYWKSVDIYYYEDLADFFAQNKTGHFFYLSKYGEKTYTNFDYSDKLANYYFIFGKETKGLPEQLISKNKDQCLRIPMNDNVRSLNLANTVAIVVYEALRQQQFNNLN